MARYRNTDRAPRDLADGSIVAAYGFTELDDEPKVTRLPKDASDEDRAAAEAAALLASAQHPHNAALIADGALIPVPEKAASKSTTGEETAQ